MMVSLIYHDYNFKFPCTPEYEDGWTSIHKLMTRKLVLQDENEVAINDRHPPVKKTIDAINLLQDAMMVCLKKSTNNSKMSMGWNQISLILSFGIKYLELEEWKFQSSEMLKCYSRFINWVI